MVKRAVKRKTTGRVSRSDSYIANRKYLGDEPVFTKPLTQLEYANSLNWYNYMCDVNDAREYISEYLNQNGRSNDAKRIKSIPDIRVPTTVAWVCRLLTRGYKLPTDTSSYIGDRISQALGYVTEASPDDPEAPKTTVQDRMREKARDILGEVEGLIDDHLEGDTGAFSFYDWLKANTIPAIYVNRIVEKLTPVLDELKLVLTNKTDEQLKEGYSHLTKAQVRAMVAFYEGMIEDATSYSSNTKKTRAPRKPRAISVEKKLKTFKYQKEDKNYKIASVQPEKIIGAQELWTFNTRYKIITVFRAIDRGGLQVKGTTILNYDPANSFSRGTGRKTEAVVQNVLQGGKIALRKLIGDLKTEKPLAHRINENTILLRIGS